MRIHRRTPSSLYGCIFPVRVQFIPVLTRCPSQPNLTWRCEFLLGTVSPQIIGIVALVDMYAEYPLTGQDWILVYTSPPLNCSGECSGLFEIEATNGICEGRPFTACPRSGFTEHNRRRGQLPAGLETTQFL